MPGGVALAARGQLGEAFTALQTALRLNPDSLEALDNLGHVILKQARWETALPVFLEVLKRQPDHAEAFACVVRIRELLCDWRTRWDDFDRLRRDVEQRLGAGKRPAVTPVQHHDHALGGRDARGVPADRLVFARHRPKGEHLARLALADLFVDTHYVNAHTKTAMRCGRGYPS